MMNKPLSKTSTKKGATDPTNKGFHYRNSLAGMRYQDGGEKPRWATWGASCFFPYLFMTSS